MVNNNIIKRFNKNNKKKTKVLKYKKMKRVKWKGPYIKNNLLKKVNDSRLVSNNKIKTMSKNSVILPKLIGLTLQIYNGQTFTVLKIIEEMVGHKLGEFVITRKQFFYKKTNK